MGSLFFKISSCTSINAAAAVQTGYLPWSWGDLKSVSQIDLSNNRLSG
jgi:hypothetical protein